MAFNLFIQRDIFSLGKCGRSKILRDFSLVLGKIKQLLWNSVVIQGIEKKKFPSIILFSYCEQSASQMNCIFKM